MLWPTQGGLSAFTYRENNKAHEVWALLYEVTENFLEIYQNMSRLFARAMMFCGIRCSSPRLNTAMRLC